MSVDELRIVHEELEALLSAEITAQAKERKAHQSNQHGE